MASRWAAANQATFGAADQLHHRARSARTGRPPRSIRLSAHRECLEEEPAQLVLGSAESEANLSVRSWAIDEPERPSRTRRRPRSRRRARHASAPDRRTNKTTSPAKAPIRSSLGSRHPEHPAEILEQPVHHPGSGEEGKRRQAHQCARRRRRGRGVPTVRYDEPRRRRTRAARRSIGIAAARGRAREGSRRQLARPDRAEAEVDDQREHHRDLDGHLDPSVLTSVRQRCVPATRGPRSPRSWTRSSPPESAKKSRSIDGPRGPLQDGVDSVDRPRSFAIGFACGSREADDSSRTTSPPRCDAITADAISTARAPSQVLGTERLSLAARSRLQELGEFGLEGEQRSSSASP